MRNTIAERRAFVMARLSGRSMEPSTPSTEATLEQGPRGKRVAVTPKPNPDVWLRDIVIEAQARCE